MTDQVQFTIVVQRTSPDVPWHNSTQENLNHVIQNYVDTGKISMRDIHVSSDNLIRTSVLNFSSIEARNEYATDPVVIGHREERDAWNETHNIKLTQVYQIYNTLGVVETKSKIITPTGWVGG
jgi:hypothetical protein